MSTDRNFEGQLGIAPSSWWKAELAVCHNTAVISVEGKIRAPADLARFIETLRSFSAYLPSDTVATPESTS